jgi:hypothetical protein
MGLDEMNKDKDDKPGPVFKEITKKLPDTAIRALAEADERRRAADAAAKEQPTEYLGRIDGPEPTRYGDWEKKGILSDF